jgi:ubiquitin-conjugating enzyme E2 C
MPYPREILLKRLNNEITACRSGSKAKFDVSDPDLVNFPVIIDVTLPKVPGPVLEAEKVVYRYDHHFRMIITQNYPYEKPRIIWLTPIFHPNIMMPEDGGHLCTRLLEDWSFNSALITFIKGIELLLLSPNGASPFGTESCTRAAQYFNAQNRRSVPIVVPVHPKVVFR